MSNIKRESKERLVTTGVFELMPLLLDIGRSGESAGSSIKHLFVDVSAVLVGSLVVSVFAFCEICSDFAPSIFRHMHDFFVKREPAFLFGEIELSLPSLGPGLSGFLPGFFVVVS